MVLDEGIIVAAVGVSIVNANRVQLVRMLVHAGVGFFNLEVDIFELFFHVLSLVGNLLGVLG